LAGSSWQFVRETDRISVVRPDGLSLTVGGLHLSHTHYRFRDEGAVQAFQIALAETLTGSGWFLRPTTLRRQR
jgi:hypothetical protein